MDQLPLLHALDLPPSLRYRLLFDNLPGLRWPRLRTGRPPCDRDLLLRILVYRCLRQIPTLSDLVLELRFNPFLLEALGRSPLQPLPSVERLSAFLRSTENLLLQQVRLQLLFALIDTGLVSGQVWALDSSAVVPALRENNLKSSLSHFRFDKSRPPRGDPQAGLGVKIHFPGQRKEVTYFWGYRNHTVSDVQSELTLWEETHPANVSEVTRAVPMLRAVAQMNLPLAFVTADSMYDVESILSFILHDLKAQPIVAHNPRSQTDTRYSVKKGLLYCAADLPLVYKGQGRHSRSGYVYRQFSCPLYWRKSVQRQYLCCPIGHPKYFTQKGCNVILRVSPTARTAIPYGTDLFKSIYQQRTAIERTYSRLLTLTMQQPTVRGLNATRNHCTIAHIATLLVALTAARLAWIPTLVH